MVKLRCLSTCYMPSRVPGVKWERYEDEDEVGNETGLYEVPSSSVGQFLDSGNFERVEPTS